MDSPTRKSVGSPAARDWYSAAKRGVGAVGAKHGWVSRNFVVLGSNTAAQSGTCASITGRSLVSNTTRGESSTTSCLSLRSYMTATKGPSATTPRQQQGPKRQVQTTRVSLDRKDAKQKKTVAPRKTSQA